MRIIVALLLAVMVALVGCAGEDAPPSDVTGQTETISQPTTPVGDASAAQNEVKTYTTGGAVSNLGHPVEYRFDFDAGGAHDYTAWGTATVASKSWTTPGTPIVSVEARCQLHPNVVSLPSESLQVTISLIPETEIVNVVNIYESGGSYFMDIIDTGDALPDTVPYGSWLTVFYQGLDTSYDTLACMDPVNQCFRYQMRHDWTSSSPLLFGSSPWLPVIATDTNPSGTVDSMSINMGTVDYTILARMVDQNDQADANPPQFSITGNFPPTLDGSWLENHDGTTIATGDTIDWDWWAPAESTIVIIPPDAFFRKTFFFVIRADGHDDPRERTGSGVKSWFYSFEDADNPGTFQRFGNSERWIDGVFPSAMADTFKFVATYALTDTVGDEIFVNDPPSWNNRTFDYAVQGRDLRVLESFDQYMIVGSGFQLINRYFVNVIARETATGTLRFHIRLRR